MAQKVRGLNFQAEFASHNVVSLTPYSVPTNQPDNQSYSSSPSLHQEQKLGRMHGVITRSGPNGERKENDRPAERKPSASWTKIPGPRTPASWIKLRAGSGFG
jgi:hypothetical protein